MAQYNLFTMAKDIATEAWQESGGDMDTAQDFVQESCDGHEISIYFGKAIQFCANVNTNDGEQWLEDCGGIAQAGDSFGNIACRIAYATLYVAALESLQEIAYEKES
jgi:hypothetical protein